MVMTMMMIRMKMETKRRNANARRNTVQMVTTSTVARNITAQMIQVMILIKTTENTTGNTITKFFYLILFLLCSILFYSYLKIWNLCRKLS